jgi:hypothetical protein
VIRATLTALLLTLLGACSSPPRVAPPAGTPVPQERPSDFVLAATVLAGARTGDPAGLPRSLQPARYIVEADGALRAATGPGSDEQTFPPRSRQLSPREFDQLWALVRDSGLLDPACPARVDDPSTIERAGPRTTALLWVSYADTAATLRVPLDRTGPQALPTERIVDRLAQWAWVKD